MQPALGMAEPRVAGFWIRLRRTGSWSLVSQVAREAGSQRAPEGGDTKTSNQHPDPRNARLRHPERRLHSSVSRQRRVRLGRRGGASLVFSAHLAEAVAPGAAAILTASADDEGKVAVGTLEKRFFRQFPRSPPFTQPMKKKEHCRPPHQYAKIKQDRVEDVNFH